MKTLKEKFGKFEMTKEQMKMVKGGVTLICTDGTNEQLYAGPTAADAADEAARDGMYFCESAG